MHLCTRPNFCTAKTETIYHITHVKVDYPRKSHTFTPWEDLGPGILFWESLVGHILQDFSIVQRIKFVSIISYNDREELQYKN